MTNIRGQGFKPPKRKRISDESQVCPSCKGCLYEDFCSEAEKVNFNKKEGEKDG